MIPFDCERNDEVILFLLKGKLNPGYLKSDLIGLQLI